VQACRRSFTKATKQVVSDCDVSWYGIRNRVSVYSQIIMSDNDTNNIPSSRISIIHLVVSKSTLLSGSLKECYNSTDTSCVGGYASVGAYSRYYANHPNYTKTYNNDGINATNMKSKVLIIPELDKSSPFVQMHPLGWSLNRYILNVIMGWNIFITSPAILTQNSIDYKSSQRDISDLQTQTMPLLLTNAAVPPSNSWHEYIKAVHFDTNTSLAVLAIDSSNELMNVDQIQSAKGMLNYIHRINVETGCVAFDRNSTYAEYDATPSDFRIISDVLIYSSNSTSYSNVCWIPVILFSHVAKTFRVFLPSIALHKHPPALIIDKSGSDPTYNIPKRWNDDNDVWVHSFLVDTDFYTQHALSIEYSNSSNELPYITNVNFIRQAYETMPDKARDDIYISNIKELRKLADEAIVYDPIVGTSGNVPVNRDDPYRRCMAGECEIGDLFTDALRWKTNSDVSFITSGGLRGPGWSAGSVHISNLWEALPFPNTVCNGTMTGVSLFNLLNYSIGLATFEGSETETGGLLLQISGVRVTYNTKLIGSRIVAIEIFDSMQNIYSDIDRLHLYTFATDSFLCSVYDRYPYLLGEGLVFDGEQPGVVSDDLHQDVVAEYLSQFVNQPYNTSIQGRLINNTEISVPLNLNQNPDSCGSGTFWNETSFSCDTCQVAVSLVNFLSEKVELNGETGSMTSPSSKIYLLNNELFPLSVPIKTIPKWVSLLDTRNGNNSTLEIGRLIDLRTGERVAIEVSGKPILLDTGTAIATVSLGTWESPTQYPTCPRQDISFDVYLRVTPQEDLNQLGLISILGYILSAVVSITAVYFCYYVIQHSKVRIVRTMQPIFLVAIILGVFIMGLSLIPLSLDDGTVLERGADIACMSIPWLFSMGFTITQSALFSKLWRINKLFNTQGLHRMQVHEKDVIIPFALLFILNFSILLIFTIVDPLQYERVTVKNEIWNSYGRCLPSGKVGSILFSFGVVVNVGALLCACYQAYKARNISDEFSESTNIGIAMFGWIQLVVLGIPVLFLIEEDNPVARYFILASLIFAGTLFV
jgi:hypothetical protein